MPADADAFDSNCITPGTAFMAQLGEAFEAWLAHKGANDPFYESVEIVFSGPDVAGEGEHKAVAYIRAQRHAPGPPPRGRDQRVAGAREEEGEQRPWLHLASRLLR